MPCIVFGPVSPLQSSLMYPFQSMIRRQRSIRPRYKRWSQRLLIATSVATRAAKAIGRTAIVMASCALRSAILKWSSRPRTLGRPLGIRIERCGIRAGGRGCTPQSQGRVGERFGARLVAPKDVLEPLGNFWTGGVAFPFPRGRMRGRRWRRRRGVIGSGRRV